MSNAYGMERLLTPLEVDRLLQLPRGRAAKLAKAKELPANVLPTGEIRFDPERLKAWLKERSQQEVTG